MSKNKLSFRDKLSIFFTWALVVFLIALIVGFIILFKNYENLKYIFMVIENVNIP